MKVKEKIVGTILIELKNNSKSIGALSLKSGYVLTKYTVKNKNLRCISDMDMSRELLRLGGLSFYDPYQIVQKTHGVMVDDCYWIRFDGENLTWEDVKHLRGV